MVIGDVGGRKHRKSSARKVSVFQEKEKEKKKRERKKEKTNQIEFQQNPSNPLPVVAVCLFSHNEKTNLKCMCKKQKNVKCYDLRRHCEPWVATRMNGKRGMKKKKSKDEKRNGKKGTFQRIKYFCSAEVSW